jgi:hypothetical protein
VEIVVGDIRRELLQFTSDHGVLVMSQNDSQAEKSTMLDLFPASLAESGMKRVEDMMSLQRQLVTYLQDVNRNCFEHMQSEAAMASEFGGRLAGARSMPDVVAAWQEWTNRHMELLARDGQHILTDTEKLIETGARVFANGWMAGKPDGGGSQSPASGGRSRGTYAQPPAPQG